VRHAFHLSPQRFLRKLRDMSARIRHIFISPGHNYFGHYGKAAGENPIVEVREVRCVAGRGLEGDRFFDFKPDYKGQITFFAWETYEALCAEFGVAGKSPGAFRRNVVVEGLDLNSLIGEEFELQGVRFKGTQESTPCEWMEEAFCAGAHAALKGRGGLRAKILSDGVLRSA
jgi:MOSC domain-containing protein YiiM